LKAKEMREKTMEELKNLLSEWRDEIFKLNVQAVTGQTEQYGRRREIRRNIARALTIVKQQAAVGQGEKKAS